MYILSFVYFKKTTSFLIVQSVPFTMNNYDLLIFPNYLQTEQAMSTEATVVESAGTIRPREEETQPVSAQPSNKATYRWSETTMSSYIKTGHMWDKDAKGNLVGYCKHKGCEVHAGASVIPVNCVGNDKYKVEGGIVTTACKDGAFFTRKVPDNKP